ncbi:predicted protein [Uncinocarpus reesii 1704]|uniref:Altered inheritance of mitochondria protein 9, mitochondrial n=1 Tax=Uncinocarpus reesii (strain UAMH 1704) TaxID=336963 RepID=C4JQ22_UNCRE|nr:uncharacterized protein UREG_03255 [Uncinocarpus reesii 1704]EEP78409.1 predicted protein [Uncinocarpus reesii 1704]
MTKAPFAYTAGRWLHLDKEQRQARYLRFDFDALCEKVLSLSPLAASIQSCQKLEGGFSRAFIFTTDDGRRVVAKFPMPVAGSPRFITNSEVATITYLKSNTKISIPEILDWNDDPSNPIGSAYIIMQHAGGVSLQQAWPGMSSLQKMHCIRDINKNIMQLSKLDFPAYGSLYFSDATFFGSESKFKLQDEKYCVGPHCKTTYWDCNVGEPRYYHFKGPNQGPSLLNQGQAVFPKLIQHPQLQSNAAPTIFHPDLHKRNIFVSEDDPTVVTNLIDWQSASIEPAFYYSDDVPDFAKPPSEETETPTGEDYCSKVYAAGLAFLAPRLTAARNIDEALLRPLRYCHRTWRDGVVPFSHGLTELRERWEELGFKDECPIPTPTVEEKRVYEERLDTYNKFLEVRQDLVETLGVEEDGWTPLDRREETVEAHRQVYEIIMSGLDNDQDRAEMTVMWPFDSIKT